MNSCTVGDLDRSHFFAAVMPLIFLIGGLAVNADGTARYAT